MKFEDLTPDQKEFAKNVCNAMFGLKDGKMAKAKMYMESQIKKARADGDIETMVEYRAMSAGVTAMARSLGIRVGKATCQKGRSHG